MPAEERLERLLDEEEQVGKVSNRDLRWMLLFTKKDLTTAIEAVEENNESTKSQVRANEVAVAKIKQAHDDCGLATPERRQEFSKALTTVVTAAVMEANGKKPIIAGLNKTELITTLVGAIVALSTIIGWIATSGRLPLPGG